MDIQDPNILPDFADEEVYTEVEDGALDDDYDESVITPDANLSDDEYKIVAAWLCAAISDAETIRDEIAKEWERNREDYGNTPIEFISEIVPDAQDIPIPVSSTKADALRDLITGSLFSIKPCMMAVSYGRAPADVGKIQTVMQRIIEETNLEERCKESSEDAWCTNHAVFRCYYDDGKYVIDTVEPECFFVGGGNKYGIENSVLVGHTYNEKCAEIEYMCEEGEYRKYDNDLDKKTYNADDSYRIAQAFFKMDIEFLKKNNTVRPVKQWYIATIDLDNQHILKMTEFLAGDRPWYFSASYLPSKKKGAFWSKRCLGTNMQGPHMMSQIVFNTAAYGGVMRAFPPIVVEGEMTDQTSKLKFGEMKQTYGRNVTAPYQQFDPSNLDVMQARLERVSDGVARISQSAQGMQYSRNMTATEAQLIAEGQGQGVSGYVSTYAIALEEMVSYIYSTLKYIGTDLLESLGLSPEEFSSDLFSMDVSWIASGRGQYASPAMRMMQLDQVNQMSQDPRLVGHFNPVEIAEAKLATMCIPNVNRIFNRDATPPQAPTPPLGGIGLPPMGGQEAAGPPPGVPNLGPAGFNG